MEWGRARDDRIVFGTWTLFAFAAAGAALLVMLIYAAVANVSSETSREPAPPKETAIAAPSQPAPEHKRDQTTTVPDQPSTSPVPESIRAQPEMAGSNSKGTTMGCNREEQIKRLRFAVTKALPADPLHDEPITPMVRQGYLIERDSEGEPQFVLSLSLAGPDVAVCAYSDETISLYVPATLFAARHRALMYGARKPHSTMFGFLPMPSSRFDALTYWHFKTPPAAEFASFAPQTEQASTVQYDARDVLFDVDQKIALFSSITSADSTGRIISSFRSRDRIAMSESETPKMLTALSALGDLIDYEDMRFETLWKAVR
jgi:hypothetical protein